MSTYTAAIQTPLLSLTKPGSQVVSAGGVGNGKGFYNRINDDKADGCSIGSIFIATTESDVSDAYKNACVEYSDKDIVMSTKISGTPATVINTPYVRKIGTKQGWLEKLLSKNKLLNYTDKMNRYLFEIRFD